MGRPRKNITDLQRDVLIKRIGAGSGRTAACQAVRLNYRLFLRAFRGDEGFRDAVLAVKKPAVRGSSRRIYELTQHEDPLVALEACRVFMSRKDRLENARRNRRERAESGAPSANIPASAVASLIEGLASAIRAALDESAQTKLLFELPVPLDPIPATHQDHTEAA